MSIYDEEHPRPETVTTEQPLCSVLDGTVRFLPQEQGFWVMCEDNPPERVEVAIVKKRKLHVITDQMLAAQRDMATNTSDRGLMGNFNLRGAYA